MQKECFQILVFSYYFEGGYDLGEFLDDYPSVSREAAIEVFQMAKASLTSEKLLHENFAGRKPAA
jgi:hypothetical protein